MNMHDHKKHTYTLLTGLLALMILGMGTAKAEDNPLHVVLEGQASSSNTKTPLWHNANKYGLSTLNRNYAYARVNVAVGQLTVNVLGVVGDDVDEGRLQFSQFVDVGKELAGARALQWWQHLERELSLALVLVDEFCNAHNACKSNTFSGVLGVYGVKGS